MIVWGVWEIIITHTHTYIYTLYICCISHLFLLFAYCLYVWTHTHTHTHTHNSKDVIHRWTYPMVPDTNLLSNTSYSFARHNIYKEKNVTLGRCVYVCVCVCVCMCVCADMSVFYHVFYWIIIKVNLCFVSHMCVCVCVYVYVCVCVFLCTWHTHRSCVLEEDTVIGAGTSIGKRSVSLDVTVALVSVLLQTD